VHWVARPFHSFVVFFLSIFFPAHLSFLLFFLYLLLCHCKRGSELNRRFSLRSDAEAVAYLAFVGLNGDLAGSAPVHLGRNYLTLIQVSRLHARPPIPDLSLPQPTPAAQVSMPDIRNKYFKRSAAFHLNVSLNFCAGDPSSGRAGRAALGSSNRFCICVRFSTSAPPGNRAAPDGLF
jgi:hypothetical protein